MDKVAVPNQHFFPRAGVSACSTSYWTNLVEARSVQDKGALRARQAHNRQMALGDGLRPGEQLFRPQGQGPDKPGCPVLQDGLRDREREGGGRGEKERNRNGGKGRKTEMSEYSDKTQAERAVKRRGGGRIAR